MAIVLLALPAYRLFRLIRTAIRVRRFERQFRKAQLQLKLGSTKEGKMTDLQLSYLRSIAKFVGGVLVAHGALTASDVSLLMPALEGLVGAVMTAYGVYESHKAHVA